MVLKSGSPVLNADIFMIYKTQRLLPFLTMYICLQIYYVLLFSVTTIDITEHKPDIHTQI